ncbi:MAG: DUF642 domain-containing protein [Akkermansiaceae bacterium]|nr:DUF642 domain-containing protein [Akkermansiaceae bacterium]MCF7730149.1 DUF642 domain-containing protein [Akkermansiaceae bacterium]
MNPDNQLRRILTSIAPILALALFLTPVSAAELISNGSFETGKDFAGAAYTAVNPGTADLPGWSGTTPYSWYINGPVWGTPAQNGTAFMNLNNVTGLNTLSQSFTAAAGTEYTVSYWTRQRGNGYMFTKLSVDAGAVTGAGAFVTGISGSGTASINQLTVQGEPEWTQYGFTFTADTTTTATLTFGNEYVAGDHGDNDGVFLDNVSVMGGATVGTEVSTTTLARSPGTGTTSTFGDLLSFDVTVSGGFGTATGAVTLKDGGFGGTPLGSATLSGGEGTITITTLAVGTHDNIVAVYPGDSTYATSTSSPLSTQTVTPVINSSLILNGSFEIGTHDSGNAHDAYLPDGWTGPAGYEWYWDGSLNAPASQDGTRHMNLIAETGMNTLSQSFTVAAGTEYTVSYWTMKRGNGFIFTTLSVEAGTVAGADAFVTDISQPTAASLYQATNVDPAWTQYGFTFTPDTNTTATLTFGNEYVAGDHGDNDGVFLDNVSVTGAGGGATFPLTITPAVSPDTGYDLKWTSQAGMLYDVLSSPDLVIWTPVPGLEGLVATPPDNTENVTPVEPSRFYRVKEYPAPPETVFSENFEGASSLPLLGWDTDAYLADTATTTWALGTPSIVGPVPPGIPLPSASNCVGTNLAATYGISSDIWLRTPSIDLTGKTDAKVVFQQWVDIDPYLDGGIGDMGTVRVLDADDLPAVNVLAVVAPDIKGLSPAGWMEFSANIPDGLGNIVVEFRFESDNYAAEDASGWYLDDVKVTVVP